MNSLLQSVDGYKTYIALAVGAVVVIVNHFVPLPNVTLDPSNWLTDLFQLALVATGRSAVTKVQK
jgi:hypothetical protein